ncbi:hypothetical protein KR054_002764, partial [Drosophila jambulina]
NMALSDENNIGYVKKVALDWREAARERRNMDTFLSTPILLTPEKSSQRFNDLKPRSRASSMGCADRRESSFYRQSFSKGNTSVEIERSDGKMESDRIRVSTDVNLYLHQPVPLNNAIKESLAHAGHAPSDTSLSSPRDKK